MYAWGRIGLSFTYWHTCFKIWNKSNQCRRNMGSSLKIPYERQPYLKEIYKICVLPFPPLYKIALFFLKTKQNTTEQKFCWLYIVNRLNSKLIAWHGEALHNFSFNLPCQLHFTQLPSDLHALNGLAALNLYFLIFSKTGVIMYGLLSGGRKKKDEFFNKW